MANRGEKLRTCAESVGEGGRMGSFLRALALIGKLNTEKKKKKPPSIREGDSGEGPRNDH